MQLDYTGAQKRVAGLGGELARVSEQLDMVKGHMDALGSGMTDAKPLVAIRQSLAKLKVNLRVRRVLRS